MYLIDLGGREIKLVTIGWTSSPILLPGHKHIVILKKKTFPPNPVLVDFSVSGKQKNLSVAKKGRIMAAGYISGYISPPGQGLCTHCQTWPISRTDLWACWSIFDDIGVNATRAFYNFFCFHMALLLSAINGVIKLRLDKND